MTDPYECSSGSLKLKNDATKKKTKKKHKAKVDRVNIDDKTVKEEISKRSQSPERTKAELAFRKIQEKRQAEKIKKLATKTHKQRVEELNTYLDSLTEHYDIPKVSWTK